MCTAISVDGKCFGRTLDYECGFCEEVILTPRDFALFGEAKNRYSILGVGVVREGVPLYFDGMNEWGLAGAALNFPGFAKYHGGMGKKAEIPSSCLLGFLLGFCKSVSEVKDTLSNVGIGEKQPASLPASPLHWMFSDRRESITVESTERGVFIMDNKVGVLTNSPDFDYQLTRLSAYSRLTPKNSENKLSTNPHSRGTGAIGLPGDFSSTSRFVRAEFLRKHTLSNDGDSQGKLFHILSSVSVPLGCIITDEGDPVSTRYTSVMDLENLVYSFTTYENPSVRSVKLYPENTELQSFSLYENHHPAFLN